MFGVAPTRAATEYGYIRPGPALALACLRSGGLSKSLRPRLRCAVSPKAVYGTPTTSCFAHPHREPESVAAVEAAIKESGTDL
jgi:hypothetical protein